MTAGDHRLLLTCEHAGKYIPPDYRGTFRSNAEILNSHRGWDPGAWEMALYLSAGLRVPLHACHFSRLLIEVNRSAHHPQLFWPPAALTEEQKNWFVREVYLPYRDGVCAAVKGSPAPVHHVSVHTFTPVFDGEIRKVDVGLLFDPDRKREQRYAVSLYEKLHREIPGLRILFNEPYKGTDDGLTTTLRQVFPDDHYAGIEIEINQAIAATPQWSALKKALLHSLAER